MTHAHPLDVTPEPEGAGDADAGGRRGPHPAVLVTICFLLHALPFLSRPALIGGDEPHYALMAHAMAVDRTLDLEAAYRRVEAGSPEAGRKAAGRRLERHLATSGSRQVFIHPLGLPALAAPLVALLAAVAPGAPPDLALGGLTLTVTFLALLAGWELMARLFGNPKDATIVTFAVYFSTPLWYYSRTFFTEPYVWAFLVLGIWCIARSRWILASLLLGLACVMKETAVLLALPVVAYVWRRHGFGRVAALSPFPLVFATAYLVKNWLVYGQPLVTFQPYRIGDPLTGAVGALFDFRHGLLPFAPVLVLAFVGWAGLRPKRSFLDDPGSLALAAFLLWFVVTASWVDWRGGSCFGPRLMAPAIITAALPLCRYWEHCAAKPAWRAAFYVLVVLGFAVQWRAVTQPFAAFWGISVHRLLAGAPISTVAGLLLGGFLIRLAPRFVMRTFAPARSAVRS